MNPTVLAAAENDSGAVFGGLLILLLIFGAICAVVDAIKKVLEAAIAAGGSSLRDFARPDGELGYFAKEWLVYGREGEACHCGSIIKRRVDSGRSTFYCSKCQK